MLLFYHLLAYAAGLWAWYSIDRNPHQKNVLTLVYVFAIIGAVYLLLGSLIQVYFGVAILVILVTANKYFFPAGERFE